MQPQGRHWVSPYTKSDGTYVPGHWADNPRRRRKHLQQKVPPKPEAASRPSASRKTGITVVITATVVGIGIAAVTLATGSSAGSASLSGEGSVPVANSGAPAEVRIAINHSEVLLSAISNRINASWAFDEDCAANSYGQVHSFFLSNPCRWLFRAAATLLVPGYGAILVAISWVSMRSTALAIKYKRLVDASGTGNTTELTRLSGAYTSVGYSGAFYASGMLGTDVWNSEVQPVSSRPVNVTTKMLDDSRQ